MVGRKSVHGGTQPVAGTGRIDWTSTFSGPKPSPGDELYIMAVATDDTVSAVPTFGSTPAGWTKLEDDSGGTRTRYALFYRLCDGTETTVDITATGSGTQNVAVAGVSICGGTRNASLSAKGSIGTSTWNTADVTTVAEFSHVFAFVGARTNGSYTPTDCIEHIDVGGGSVTTRVGIFEQMTKDASTRNCEGTTSGTTSEPFAYVIVIEPDDPAFTDSFTRTENPVASGWGPAGGIGSSQLEANGTQLKASGVGTNVSYITDRFERDAEISATIATKGATNDLFSLWLRINNPASGTFNALELRYEPLAGTDTIKFFRWVGGSGTQIGSTINQEVNNGDKLRFRAIGTHYAVDIDTGSGWTEIGSVDDTGSVVTRGWAAVRCNNTTYRVDDVAFDRIDREGHAEYIHAITSGGSTTAATTTSVTLPIAYPGDVWLLHFHNYKTTGGNPTVTVPGFTQHGTQVNDGDHSHMLFYRECDGTEGDTAAATITRTATATSSTRWRIGAISVIADPSDHFATDPYNENVEATSTTWQTDSIAQAAGDLLIVWVSHQGTNTNTATNDDAAAVETQDSASNSSGTHVAIYIKRIVTGTTDDATGTLSATNPKVSFIYTINQVQPLAPTTDADTVYLDLTPSGVDEYTGATEYTDSGTVYLALTPSGTEQQVYGDSGTAYLDLSIQGWDGLPVAHFLDEITSAHVQDSTFDVDMPPLAGAGDLVLIHYVTFNAFGGTNNAPSASGWNVQSGATGPVRTHICSRVLDGSEGATVTFTIGGSGPTGVHNEVHSVAYRGAVGVPASVTFGSGSGTAFNPTDVAVAQDEVLLTFITWWNNASDLIGFTPSSQDVAEQYHAQPFEENLGLYEWMPLPPATTSIQGTFQTLGTGQQFQYAELIVGVPAAVDYTDSGTVYLDLTPSFAEGVSEDTGTIYLDLTPSGTEFIHQCKPRFRGELLTWTYDPDAMTTNWFGGVLLPDWHGELLAVEMVANYAC